VEEPAAQSGRRRRRLSRGAVVVGVLGIVFLLVGLNGGSYQGKLPKVEKNDNTAFLPNSAQSTKVDKEAPATSWSRPCPASWSTSGRAG
jgi:RND superfamily putative drug exporter